MRVCVVGSGGREHGLAAVVLGRDAEVVVTPGQPRHPRARSTPPPEEIDADLFVIGPEVPLVDGLADRLRAAGPPRVRARRRRGPDRGSKAFMKDLARRADLPTARHGVFEDEGPALDFLRTLPGLYVVKTDGLAAGKGVLVTESLAEAEDDVRAKLAGTAFGDAGRTVVIEEGLRGPEVSVFAVCDGDRAVALPPAQDFKRVGDGDTGPEHRRRRRVVAAPVPRRRLRRRGRRPLRRARPCGPSATTASTTAACCTPGLMVTPEGPKLIEYNIRFGDPDSQVVLLRATSDIAALLAEAAAGRIETEPVVRRRRRGPRRRAGRGLPRPHPHGRPHRGPRGGPGGRGRRGAHAPASRWARMGGS